jgi:hypothetical protein
MSNPQAWAEAVSDSIAGLDPAYDINDYTECEHDDSLSRCLQAIMEPNFNNTDDMNSYYEFFENDMENWASWIQSNFGQRWGWAAEHIVEEGY